MRILLSCGWILFLSLSLLGQRSARPKLKTGDWTGKLSLASNTTLPFQFFVSKSDSTQTGYVFTVLNGEEKIVLHNDKVVNDSIQLEFPSFGTKLILKVTGKKTLSGYWVNYNKGVNYRIPCRVNKGYVNRFDNPKLYLSTIFPGEYNGRWESTFEPGTPDEYKAVGLFKQSYNSISGTFLTETGDYRFLDGNVVGDSLFLSCFDGSHAFLFTGKLENNKIAGRFYSGKHWQADWTAVRNESFELTSPDSLTYVINNQAVTFKLKDLTGNDFLFPNEHYKNKVTIIQIMGTWCPNCMDETRYFKDLYSKYHSQGLEIISICYETGTDPLQHLNRIQTLKERMDLDFQFLVGGTANKGLASQHFSMLNQVISFPTAIFIGRDGVVKKVHTGFNGPGTGSYYESFIKDTELFIQELLK